ncbi:hypothetical protein SAMN05421540_10813 [Psychroflexus halocasei]|uniref:Uncharacterized protein n=1 Tax=Psychroflexus halocasei TaxID=908615 RepID=A0A1H4CGW4_9FLAO|nr:hypothetical protein SAMN05421540_10813 [Psychroflexus halocasei]
MLLCSSSHSISSAFNRTLMELKFTSTESKYACSWSFNRTLMELKFAEAERIAEMGLDF